MIWKFFVEKEDWISRKMYTYLIHKHKNVEYIILPRQRHEYDYHHDVNNTEKMIYFHLEDVTHDINDKLLYNLYYPLFMANICNKMSIDFIYITNMDMNHSSDIYSQYLEDMISFYEITYIKLGHLVFDELNNPQNILYKIIHDENDDEIMRLSVLSDVLPILYDIIQCNKKKSFELTNPSVISPFQFLQLYKEYIDQEYTINIKEKTVIYDYGPQNPIENEYFILPIYQSLQRLFKKIRKQNVILNHIINLDIKNNILIKR